MASPQSLQQITQELKTVGPTQAQRRAITNRQAKLGGEFNTQSQQLTDKIQTDALNSARRRGLGFSGIPISEAADRSAPALAQLRSDFNDRELGLSDRLFELDQGIFDRALGIRQGQVDRQFQADQAQLNRDAQQRASSAAAGAQFQPIIESLRAQISALTQGDTPPGSAPARADGLIQAENNPNIFFNPQTGTIVDRRQSIDNGTSVTNLVPRF